MRETENYWTRLGSRRASRRRFVAGSGVLAAGTAAILAGCGDDDESAPTATPTAPGTGTPSAATPVRGGTLRNFKLAVDPGVDPAIYHLNNYEPVNLTYTQVSTYQVSKNLIAFDGMVSMEQVDPTTIVWKVRPNMRFHNGDPVTGEDWAYSMTRIPVLTKERRGHTGTPLFNYIESTTATDELTVQMKLLRPNPSTPIHMSRQYFAFVNKKVAEASPNKDVQDGPRGAGSGPYLLDRRDATGTRLVRNPDYYKHEPAMDGFTGDGPYIDNIETRVIADLAAQKAAFLSGDLDVFGGIDPLEVDDFKRNNRVVVAEAPNAALVILAFDHKKLFDRRARQALRRAVNYEAFGASIFGGNFKYTAPVNTVLTGFQPWDQAKLKAEHKYDPAEAKQLWEAAGRPVDTIRILTGNDGQRGVVIADFAAQSIRQALGINAVVEQVDSQTWAQRANAVPDKDWELLQSGQGIAGPTSGVPEDSSLIWFDWRAYMPLAFNAAIDRDDLNAELRADGEKLLAMMRANEQELDAEARKAGLDEIQQFIYDNALTGITLPVATNQNLGFSNRLQDVNYADWPHYYALRRQSVWIKQA
jgi:peptide/nickel transport system substrate-binding protein